MPVYVYACSNCGHRFEEKQSFNDDALTVCPDCGQSALRKVFNSVGIVFKGSGFYRTDSRSGGSSTVSSGNSSSDSTAKSAESKPADSASSSGGDKKKDSSSTSSSAGSTSKTTS